MYCNTSFSHDFQSRNHELEDRVQSYKRSNEQLNSQVNEQVTCTYWNICWDAAIEEIAPWKICNDFIQKWATSLIEMVQIVLYIKVLE